MLIFPILWLSLFPQVVMGNPSCAYFSFPLLYERLVVSIEVAKFRIGSRCPKFGDKIQVLKDHATLSLFEQFTG
jgi:hypothetical protein